ncbi:MAG: hypothetical protein KC910_09740 [Candidatus Eremiobacteraeota bacterium]|nr:hypothetical protein [Candidatus Eremiobacteraeota bacterium]
MRLTPISNPSLPTRPACKPASPQAPEGVKWTASEPEDKMDFKQATPTMTALALTSLGATVALGAGLVAGGAFSTPVAAALTTSAVVGGFFATDLGSGVVHHFLDNVNADALEARGGLLRKTTARIARDFQNHHHHTRDMVHRSFAHHTYDTQRVAAPLLVGLAGLAWTVTSSAPAVAGPLLAGLATMANCALVAQEAHKRCHMSDDENPGWVKGLQKANIWVNQDLHNQHHTQGHQSHYALLNGFTNKVLDGLEFRIGDGPKTNILRKLEVGLYHWQGGIEPNAWVENEGLREKALGMA